MCTELHVELGKDFDLQGLTTSLITLCKKVKYQSRNKFLQLHRHSEPRSWIFKLIVILSWLLKIFHFFGTLPNFKRNSISKFTMSIVLCLYQKRQFTTFVKTIGTPSHRAPTCVTIVVPEKFTTTRLGKWSNEVLDLPSYLSN